MTVFKKIIPSPAAVVQAAGHSERKHSRFSASGAERWMSCPGSVALNETVPSRTNVWAVEGTKAHEVLEATLKLELAGSTREAIREYQATVLDKPREMVDYADQAAAFVTDLYYKDPGSEILLETRVMLDFLHPDAFGTFDIAVAEHFDTLHLMDYKYGAGVAVSPVKSLQLIFYSLALAYKWRWNFTTVRHWIIQPRVKGYEGPLYWDAPIEDIKGKYLDLFAEGIARVEREPDRYVEGKWCHWCNAKSICPLKKKVKFVDADLAFSPINS